VRRLGKCRTASAQEYSFGSTASTGGGAGAGDELTVTQNRRLVDVAPTHAQAVSRGTSSKQSQVPDLTTYFFFDTYLTT
jgi:hypothetical protein